MVCCPRAKTFAVFHLQREQPLNGNIAPLNRNMCAAFCFGNEAGSRSKFWSITLRKRINVNTLFGSARPNFMPWKFINIHFCRVDFFFFFPVVALSLSASVHRKMKCCCFLSDCGLTYPLDYVTILFFCSFSNVGMCMFSLFLHDSVRSSSWSRNQPFLH